MKNFKNFIDEDGLWCCGGRLSESNLPYSTIHPYFVSKEHYFPIYQLVNGMDKSSITGLETP